MTIQDFLKKYNIRLNEQQLEAMQAVDGPVLTLATPGSGKTTLFVARLGYMILVKGISPDKILPMTYTKPATKDMSKRFRIIFGELADKVEFKTINAVCYMILDEYARRIGKKVNVVIQENEQAKYISNAFRQVHNEYPTESDISELGTAISRAKNMMLKKDDLKKIECEVERFPEIFDTYNDLISKSKKMDYDDQLIFGHQLLKDKPEMHEWACGKYDYISVDECQDNSKIQNEIIKLLSVGKNNVFEVGDLDQSIYGFRGADPHELLNFKRDYPEARILYMEPNYRCDRNIIVAADRFIQLNKKRYPIHVTATRPAINKIKLTKIENRYKQYEYIKEMAVNAKEPTAFLYRDNESSLPIIDLFLRNGIPYDVKELDRSFFSHVVVNDIKDILRFSFDFSNTEIFSRIYYKLGLYINSKTKEQACKIIKQPRHEGMSVFDALYDICRNNQRAIRGIETSERVLRNIRQQEPISAIYTIVNVIGYGDYLRQHHLSSRKIEILKSLAYHEHSIGGFLDRLDKLPKLISSVPRQYSAKAVLSTIHSAKGLEWPSVVIVDAYDGCFPQSIADYTKDDANTIDTYEEERRAYYIAVTRARDELNILVYGDCANTFTNQLMGYDNAKVSHTNSVRSFSKSHIANKPSVKVATSIERPFIEAEYREFKREMKPGRTVYHKQYGCGKIMYVEMDEVAIRIGDSEKMFSMKTLFTKELIRFRSGY